VPNIFVLDLKEDIVLQPTRIENDGFPANFYYARWREETQSFRKSKDVYQKNRVKNDTFGSIRKRLRSVTNLISTFLQSWKEMEQKSQNKHISLGTPLFYG